MTPWGRACIQWAVLVAAVPVGGRGSDGVFGRAGAACRLSAQFAIADLSALAGPEAATTSGFL